VLLALSAGIAGGATLGGALGITGPTRPEAPPPPGEQQIPAAPAPRLPGGAVTSLPAEVLRVIDGDTFEARVRVWPGLDITTKVRLRGIDAPEMRARCPAERVKAEAARDALKAMLANGPVAVSAVAPDKYGGRVVANTSTGAIADVSAELLGRGLARQYAGGHRDGWCDGAP
jgi:endonuclease YncB( thermonuclease family)